MIQIDLKSLLVSVSGEIVLRDLEAELARKTLTIGLLTDSIDTVESRLRDPSVFDRSPLYGKFVDSVVGLEIHTRDGRHLIARPAPRKATGADWRTLLTGSQARVVSATLCVYRKPDAHDDFAWQFPSRASALEAARMALVSDVRPATWSVIGRVLCGQLEGPADLVHLEQGQLVALAAKATRVAQPVRPAGGAAFATWSTLFASERDVFEMTLDGGLVAGLVPTPSELPVGLTL